MAGLLASVCIAEIKMIGTLTAIIWIVTGYLYVVMDVEVKIISVVASNVKMSGDTEKKLLLL